MVTSWKCGEISPNLQLREPSMQPAENARVVACNKENLVTLQVQVAIEHGYEMRFWGYDLSLRDTVECNSKPMLNTLGTFG